MNTRYIKINSCQKCEHTGHSSNGKEITFICANPIHKNMDVPRLKIDDEYYPITSIGTKFSDNVIPDWCKLPSHQEVIEYK